MLFLRQKTLLSSLFVIAVAVCSVSIVSGVPQDPPPPAPAGGGPPTAATITQATADTRTNEQIDKDMKKDPGAAAALDAMNKQAADPTSAKSPAAAAMKSLEKKDEALMLLPKERTRDHFQKFIAKVQRKIRERYAVYNKVLQKHHEFVKKKEECWKKTEADLKAKRLSEMKKYGHILRKAREEYKKIEDEEKKKKEEEERKKKEGGGGSSDEYKLDVEPDKGLEPDAPAPAPGAPPKR